MDDEPYLVPGRTCGECVACCTALAIVDDALIKLPGVACVHCTVGVGCGIYDSRPSLCRSYFCLWRSIPDLADDWRPDLSGVMIVPRELPPGYQGPFGVNLILVGDPKILTTEKFASLVAGFIDRGTPTYLDVPGPAGMYGQIRLLNPVVTAAIAARNLAMVKSQIWTLFLAMKAAPSRPITDEDLQDARNKAIAPSRGAP